MRAMLMCWEDVEKDLIYFVMPLYPADLATVLLEKEEIPMVSRYLMCKELICALVALRHLGVVHSDIKPANILIGHDGRAVLTDFGNAKEVPVYDFDTWRGYARDGTYCYMAPEMVSADVRRSGYGTNVDVWSMGLVLMEIIGFCDGPFFHQRSLDGVQDEHANSGRLPIDPDKFLCTDEKFWEILPAMLHVDPKKRITARQLEDKYVRSEEWTAIRNGSATHDWRPTVHLPAADVEDAKHFLDFSPYSDTGRAMASIRSNILDTV
ncbi:kinase-like domain-containing protein [Cerioporus squamosus]|nr:kinase-like domain-containing protein [Cerioporus squamosus]